MMPPMLNGFRDTMAWLAAALAAMWLAGCAVQVQKTDVIQPVENKFTIYNAVEIPPPLNPSSPPEITNDLHEKMLLQIGTIGKFRRVGAVIPPERHNTLVIKTTIIKWDKGNRFLRWMSAVTDLGAKIYESYAKQEIGNVSGTMGDGFLQVEIQFVDKKAQEVIGKLSIKALADSPDSYRSAEDRAVDGLVAYFKTRL
jgi:hypothetical protein